MIPPDRSVTATRTEIPLSDAIVPVTVISREDIELSLATDLGELLRFQAGIDIGRPHALIASPASDRIALSNHRHELVVVDLEGQLALDLGRQPHGGGHRGQHDGRGPGL